MMITIDLNKDIFYSKVQCDFKWMAGLTYRDLEVKESLPKRVCFVGVQAHRIWLQWDGSEFSILPTILVENVWTDVYKHEIVVSGLDSSCFVSEEAFTLGMKKALYRQFPNEVYSYFGQEIDRKTMSSIVRGADVLQDLDTLGIPYEYVDVKPDPEWDGAVGVRCSFGILVIPFKGDRLLHTYLTFNALNYWECFWLWFDNLCSRVREGMSRLWQSTK